jgi:hypothetical protein
MSIITLGQDCSAATALRTLSMRNYALPFDWIRSNPEILSEVILNNFKGFHESLKLSENKNYVIDSYGLEFPHDYPTVKQPVLNMNDEDIFEHRIIDTWEEYIPSIQEKYKRRIERFHSIMNSEEPVLALFAGQVDHVNLFKNAFKIRYNKTNVYYTVLSEECISDEQGKNLLENHNISLCEPEEILIDENGNMAIDKTAQAKLWFDAINKIHLKI